jgi:polar amino acid transport system substrate-binding protein
MPSNHPIRLIVFLVSLTLAIAGCGAPARQSGVVAPPSPQVLRVGVTADNPPLIYRQGKEIAGLEAELAKELAAYLGKSLQFVEVPWTDQIPALLENRTDIIMSGMSVTRMREMRISFSEPYFRTGQMAMVPRENRNRFPTGYYGILGQSPALRFGVVRGTTGEKFVRDNFEQAAKIKAFETPQEGFDRLLSGLPALRIDIFIHDGPVLMALAAEKQSSEVALLPSLLTEEYLAWGVRKTDPALLEAADRFLKTVREDGRLEMMLKRWLPYAP